MIHLKVYLSLNVTDHYSIFHINRQITSEDSEVYVFKRSYSLKNKNAFLDTIRGIDWNEIYNIYGTPKCFHLFHGKLLTLLNKFFPKVRRKMKYNNKKPWLSEAMRNSKLYYTYRVQSVHNETMYKSYEFRLQKVMIVKVKVKEFYCNKIINIHGATQRLKSFWVYLPHTILASVTLQWLHCGDSWP